MAKTPTTPRTRSAPDGTPLRLGVRSYWAYAAGSIGTGGFSALPGLLLLVFLTDELGVAASVAGLIVLGAKVWDVVLNPLVGSWSDRTSSRWGPRVPWMLAGSVILPVFFFAMFAPPTGWPTTSTALYVFVAFIFAATGYAFFQVPYVALPAEITDSYQERTTLISIRIVVLTVAILLFGGGAPLLVDAFGGGPAGYAGMGIVAALALAAGFLTASIGMRRVPVVVRSEAAGSLREQLAAIRESADFRTLFAAFTVQALAAGTMLAGIPYVAQHLLGSRSAITVLFIALVGPALLVMPLWRALATRAGKRVGFQVATTIFLIGAASATLSVWVPGAATFLSVAVCGVGYAGMQMFPLAMLPDTIEEDTRVFGRRRAGTLTGVWTAGETLGLAVGPAIFSVVLAVGGYVSTTAGEEAAQPASAHAAIAWGFGVLPSAMVLLSLLFIRRYRLTAERLKALEAPTTTPSTPD